MNRDGLLILGIDPGLRKTGWGLVRSRGHALKFVASGSIKTEKTTALPQRLAEIHRQLAAIINEWKPDSAAVEETFINNNAASALKLGQARGVALSVPAILNVPVSEYTANHIKKAVTGTGHAAKEQIMMMIGRLLPTAGKISEDEADALAVAICHAHHGTSRSVLQKAMAS